MILQHVGTDHPAPLAVTLALAFGPFLLLAVVVVLRRRADGVAERPPADEHRGDAPPRG